MCLRLDETRALPGALPADLPALTIEDLWEGSHGIWQGGVS